MSKTISSQRFLSTETVEQKRAAKDYEITVSPDFVVDGTVYRVLMDGHHSLAAAKADGVEPVVKVATVIDSDRVSLLDNGVEDFLAAEHMGDDWYDVATGREVW